MNIATTTEIERTLDAERIRADFPILKLKVGGKPLVYLDNAASSQMPQPVIDRLVRYQTSQHANIHRGVHHLSEVATNEYEQARQKVKRFINAREEREVIFTSGTTESINLVMHGYGRKFIGAGDEIILTTLEHHSNIVPWQMLAEEKGARIRVVPINDAGELLVDEYEKLFNERTKFVGVMHVSNALGTINPVKSMMHSRTSAGYRCSSMARRPRRICASMCRISTATSTRSRRTNCAAPRALAFCMERRLRSSACSRSRAAAT